MRFSHVVAPEERAVAASFARLYIVPQEFRLFEVQNADGTVRRPATDKVFPTSKCDYTGLRKCDVVELAYRNLECFYRIQWSNKAKYSGRTLSFDFLHYTRGAISSLLVLSIHGVANGFTSCKSRPGNSMSLFRGVFRTDKEQMEHYDAMMMNVMIYFFEYLVPREDHSYLFQDVMNKTVTTMIQTCKGRHRIKHRLWSNRYIYDHVYQIGSGDFNLCKGHNYKVALIMD